MTGVSGSRHRIRAPSWASASRTRSAWRRAWTRTARYIDGLAALGFGSIEIGTVTPRAQPGNPRPRMFRLPAARAIINRMGFNNGGVDAFVPTCSARASTRKPGVLGLNIGKNADTPIERAADDYLECLRKVYPPWVRTLTSPIDSIFKLNIWPLLPVSMAEMPSIMMLSWLGRRAARCCRCRSERHRRRA